MSTGDQDSFLPDNFHTSHLTPYLLPHPPTETKAYRRGKSRSLYSWVQGEEEARDLESWAWGPPSFWDPEEQGGRMPMSLSQALPPGLFTYLLRLVSTAHSSSRASEASCGQDSCERGQASGEGRDGFPTPLPLSIIGLIPVSGRGVGFATTCPGRDSGKGQRI